MPKIKTRYNNQEKKHFAIVNGEETRNAELIGWHILGKLDLLHKPKKNISKQMDNRI